MSAYSLETINSFIAMPSPLAATTTPHQGLTAPNGTSFPSSPYNVIAADMKDRVPFVVKLSESKGADHLDKSFFKDNSSSESMFFDSYTASALAVGQALWSPPTNDATIPRTPEQEQVIVRRINDALCDLDSANDTADSAYRKRFVAGKTCYEAWTIEALSWEILKLVKDLHTSGFKTPIFDRQTLADIGQTEHWTFEQRIDMICQLLRISKNVAVTVMKHEKIWTTIGAPHKLYQANNINTRSNKNRNKDVKLGRAQRKREADEDIRGSNKAARMETAPEAVVAKVPSGVEIEHVELLLSLRGC